jgi:hypothetical protein
MTPTQKNMQAQQMLEINTMFGREVFPPSMIIKDMNLSGKAEAMEFLKKQEEAAAANQEHATTVQHAAEEAKIKELYSKAVANIARAREDHGRAESNIGLFEERLSEISQNRALATKHKMDALAKLVETLEKFGQVEANLAMNELQNVGIDQESEEDRAKADAKRTALSNEFVAQMLVGMPGMGQQSSPQQEQQMV